MLNLFQYLKRAPLYCHNEAIVILGLDPEIHNTLDSCLRRSDKLLIFLSRSHALRGNAYFKPLYTTLPRKPWERVDR